MKSMIASLKGGLIVSAQALEDEPLYCDAYSLMPFMAKAALEGGACAIRANSVRDIQAIKATADVLVIGLIKKQYEGFSQHITVTMDEIDALVSCGADIIALDCTNRPRVDGLSVAQFIAAIKEKYPTITLMADISNVEEGIEAARCGVDLVGTTLSGYTDSTPHDDGPDVLLVKTLVSELEIPVIAEGRIHTPEQAKHLLELGAHAIVVGGAITRPKEITQRFMTAIREVPSCI